MSESYIDIGYDVNRQIRKDAEERSADAEARFAAPRRFWIPNGGSTKIIFLDDVPACTYEYNLELKKPDYERPRWGHYYTCTRNQTGVDIFAGLPDRVKRSRTYMGFLTVIECTEYESNGKQYKNVRRVIPMTTTMTARVEGWKEDRKGNLVGAMFNVKRGNDKKSPRVGDDWQFNEFVDLSTILDAQGEVVDPTPADYAAMLKPKTQEQIINELMDAGITLNTPGAPADAGNAAADSTTSDGDQEVPF